MIAIWYNGIQNGRRVGKKVYTLFSVSNKLNDLYVYVYPH